MRRRTGVPIMVLCMLVVAGCSDQGPLGGAEKRIDELFAKGPDVMTSLTMTNDSLTVDIVRNEQRLVWELYPEPDAALTPTSITVDNPYLRPLEATSSPQETSCQPSFPPPVQAVCVAAVPLANGHTPSYAQEVFKAIRGDRVWGEC